MSKIVAIMKLSFVMLDSVFESSLLVESCRMNAISAFVRNAVLK